MVKHGLILALSAWATIAWADELRHSYDVSTGFKHRAQIEASPDLTAGSRTLVRGIKIAPEAQALLDQSFSSNSAHVMILSHRGQIVYDRRSWSLPRSATPLGYSVSKSLVSLAAGRALCQGHIKSLDDPAASYVPELKGTSWGQSRVRDLLTMSSGAFASSLAHHGHRAQADRDTFDSYFMGVMRLRLTDVLPTLDDRANPPGSKFNYSNMDTLALGLVVERATNQPFARYFAHTVWRAVDPEDQGHWITSRLGEPATYAGFSAKPEDWIRLGQWVLSELDQPGCFGDYLRQATRAQISTGYTTGPTYLKSYGYQIWTDCGPSVDFCFLGFANQYLLFNLRTNTVLYHHAANTRFRTWPTIKNFDQALQILESNR